MFLGDLLDSDSEQIPNLDLDPQGLFTELDQQQQKVIKKNTNYTKNLGGGGARYDAQDIDLNKFTFANPVQEKARKQSQESLNGADTQFQILDIPENSVSENLLEDLVLSKQISQQQQCHRDEIKVSNNWVMEEIQKQQQLLEQIEEQEKRGKDEKEVEIQIAEIEEISYLDLLPIPPLCPYPDPIQQLKLPEYLQQFLISPIPSDGMFQCYIVRDKSGLNRFMPKYRLYWSQTNQFLLAAKKALNRSKYTVTQDSDFKQKEEVLLLGKVEISEQSNADYHLFDNGVKKKDQSNFKKLRVQLGSVFFDTNFDSSTRPRRMALVTRKSEKEILQFISRKPQVINTVNCKVLLNLEKKLYSLDFFGRVKKPSVKNFQLVLKGDDKDRIYVQFGKVQKDLFNLDFTSPLSPLIAFQLALCNFDFKGKA